MILVAGRTKGYRNHPQLVRFKLETKPLASIGTYLMFIHAESESRGYNFDATKILKTLPPTSKKKMRVTFGQAEYEFKHLKKKLKKRSPTFFKRMNLEKRIELHPLFQAYPGDIEFWEII